LKKQSALGYKHQKEYQSKIKWQALLSRRLLGVAFALFCII